MTQNSQIYIDQIHHLFRFQRNILSYLSLWYFEEIQKIARVVLKYYKKSFVLMILVLFHMVLTQF